MTYERSALWCTIFLSKNTKIAVKRESRFPPLFFGLQKLGCPPRFWLNTGPAFPFSAEVGRPPDTFPVFFVYINENLIPGAALNTALTPMVIEYAAHCTAVLLVVAVGGEGGRR